MKRHPYGILLVAVLAAVIAMALVGCAGGGASGGSTGAGGYGTPPDPATLDVKVGDTVTFKNEDSAPHNVNIDGKDLGAQDPGASVTWKAEKAGSFPYSCTIHPSMTGEIVVK
jgi:plastocyanin